MAYLLIFLARPRMHVGRTQAKHERVSVRAQGEREDSIFGFGYEQWSDSIPTIFNINQYITRYYLNTHHLNIDAW
jgi:hypothetical protein